MDGSTNIDARGLRLDHVRIALDGRDLISLTASVGPGEVLAVMGPSGVGKSTLLAYVAGALAPSFVGDGDLWLDGVRINDLPTERRSVGLLFQDDLLFPHLSVGGNLAFAIPAEVSGRAARRRLIDAALEEAGLAGMAERDPATLSGGQRARVSLLRVLLSRPKALLLDEPFSKLDATLRDQFRRFVFDQARDRGLPTIIVTHDPADAAAAGPGVRIVELTADASSAAAPCVHEALDEEDQR